MAMQKTSLSGIKRRIPWPSGRPLGQGFGSLWRGLMFFMMVLVLACGGGAGGGTSSDSSNPLVPYINVDPADATVVAGQRATFTVGASGQAPMTYQWYVNGAPITDATGSSYTTPVTSASDDGDEYWVEVTNAEGWADSGLATLRVSSAPAITTQPNSASVSVGQTATFSVAASGTAPLWYQWYKNGAAIGSASGSSYRTPATVAGDSGSTFYVVVSNAAGSVTSAGALLFVSTSGAVSPTITTQPASQTVSAGQAASFSVTATGTAPLSYQWRKNGTAIGSATNASYITPATVAGDNGATFSVVVTNSAGSVTSGAALLTVNAATGAPPAITTQPASLSVNVGQTATFTVVASGSGTLSYQWSKNGTAITAATSSSYTTPATVAGDGGSTFKVAVSNASGTVTSLSATLTVSNLPTITTQPASQSVALGQAATFSVTTGGGTPTCQWYKNGVIIPGAASSSYTTPATVIGDSGSSFTVTASNAYGSVTSNAAILTVTNPPAITAQPASLAVTVGQTAIFSVTVSGGTPLTFQWLKNGVAIGGATTYAYTTPVTALTDNGARFSVAVTNSYGTVTSAAATLTVTAPVAPSFTTQPVSQSVTLGQSAQFGVLTAGTAPITFQWLKNAVVIPSATASFYTTPATAAGDAGSTYSVVATNAAGNVTSNSATLTVSLAPLITVQPVTRTVSVGSAFSFSVTALGAATLSYQWKFNSVNIVGGTSSTLYVGTAQASNAGSYTVTVANTYGSATSSAAILAVEPSSAMTVGRHAHTATLLGNGLVLVAGGQGNSAILASSELYTPGASSWTATAALNKARQSHTATLLGSGQVLAAGGDDGSTAMANAESFNPSTNQWTSLAPMASARTLHTATLLGNGKVLVAGGSTTAYSGSALASAELYDPATGTWSPAASMAHARNGQVACLLGNGKVLVAGGYGAGNLSSAELYDPATNTWTSVASLAQNRTNASATLLGNGSVLVAGGYGDSGYLAGAELFNPATGTWSSGGTMATARYFHSATLLGDGTVLISGGTGTFTLASAELYSPSSSTWSASVPLVAARYRHAATLLPGGTILMDGGYYAMTSSEVYTPQAYSTGLPAITTQPASHTINAGQTATFTATASGTAPLTYQWLKNGSAIMLATSASYTTPAATVADSGSTFSVTVSNSAGSITSSNATLTVNAVVAAPVINSFGASPASIPGGTGSILSWNVTGATALSISGVGTETSLVGSQNVTPAATTTYTLTATNAGGTVIAQVTVTVTAPVIASFTANPAAIAAGGSSTLSWSVAGATSLSLNQSIGTVTGNSRAVTPSVTTTYTLTASNAIGTTYASAAVTVSSAATGILQNTIPVWNASTTYVANAVATLSKTGQASVVATSNASGAYSLTAAAGPGYGMTVAATGYLPQTWYNLTVATGVTTYLERDPMVSTAYASGTGTVSGTLTNALDGTDIQGMTINLSSGIINTSGTVLATTVTDPTGYYSFAGLAPGYYTAVTSCPGFQASYFTLVVAGGYTTSNLNFSISPLLAAGEIRIVTTWGSSPLDLDNHLFGPSINGGQFHVWYDAATDVSASSVTYVDLDWDVQNGFGPETDTIHTTLAGTYSFYVNDYSDERVGSGYLLANSAACVKVFTSAGLAATFYVPYQTGSLWHVFDLDGTTWVLTPVNAMSFTIPEDVWADMAAPQALTVGQTAAHRAAKPVVANRPAKPANLIP